jgi:hypothetical protein
MHFSGDVQRAARLRAACIRLGAEAGEDAFEPGPHLGPLPLVSAQALEKDLVRALDGRETCLERFPARRQLKHL